MDRFDPLPPLGRPVQQIPLRMLSAKASKSGFFDDISKPSKRRTSLSKQMYAYNCRQGLTSWL